MKAPRNRPAWGGKPALGSKSRASKPHGKSRRERGGDADIPRQWVWHYETLSSLRERLIQERKEWLSEASQPIEPHSMSQADSATDEFDHDLALSRLSVDQDALYEVEAAMKRILDGKYGICEQTGKPIPAGRLKVLPWTRYRKEVANRLERTGLIPPTQLGRLGHAQREREISDGH
jgi:RNA polymerase-binding transcription factor DksA